MFTGESRFEGGGQQEQRVPIVEVACKHGKWWSIPRAMSAELYELYANGENAVYTWDGGEKADVLVPGARMVKKHESTDT